MSHGVVLVRSVYRSADSMRVCVRTCVCQCAYALRHVCRVTMFRITFAESCAVTYAVSVVVVAAQEVVVVDLFSLLDRDRDGFIGLADLVAIAGDRGAEALCELDPDGGVIDLRLFLRTMCACEDVDMG